MALMDDLLSVFPEAEARQISVGVSAGKIFEHDAHEMVKHQATVLFTQHLRGCRVCRLRNDPSGQPLQPILCAEGKRLINIFQSPAEISRVRREAADKLAVEFAASLAAAG